MSWKFLLAFHTNISFIDLASKTFLTKLDPTESYATLPYPIVKNGFTLIF